MKTRGVLLVGRDTERFGARRMGDDLMINMIFTNEAAAKLEYDTSVDKIGTQ